LVADYILTIDFFRFRA